MIGLNQPYILNLLSDRVNMSCPLSMMVLYTNDAVDVLYADKSMLQLSPCGTNYMHHASPREGIHPLSGLRTVQQLSRYATSEFQHKVQEALDFRNMFAEHPYLCPEFQSGDETVYQYAEIKQLAWPKELDVRSCDYFEDGGIRVTSLDQYGSLVLSAHRHDFTVCFLSAISKDQQKSQVSFSKPDSQQKHIISEIEQKNVNRLKNNDGVESSSKIAEDLNISPISRTSNESRSPPEAAPDDLEYQRYSTPTRELGNEEEPVVTPYGKTAVFRNQNFLTHDSKTSESDKAVPQSSNNLKSNNDMHTAKTLGSEQPNCISEHDGRSEQTSSARLVAQCVPQTEDLKTRHPYTWVTRHYSCCDHPMCWKYPVSLASQAIERQSKDKQNGPLVMRRSVGPSTFPVKINPDQCVMTSVPSPIPLTCPGKHLHKLQLQPSQDTATDIMTWKRGKLKVILIDGVIYRIVRLPSVKLMEIYPGDGTVVVSQGLTGHIFTHMIPHGNKVEEKTYSAKTTIPPGASSAVGVQKLIHRGYRFLKHANEEDKLSSVYDVCCWKHEAVSLTRPEKAVLLEECSVPGHGRFSAYSDGRVRVMFTDRTSLDMVSDFANHIAVIQSTAVSRHQQSEKRRDLCRLFLPNGQYCMVDINRPRQYSRYVQAALEWVAWVNSTPLERRSFYRQDQYDPTKQISAEKELEKINCFNYILDNTAFSVASSNSKKTIGKEELLKKLSRSHSDEVSQPMSASKPGHRFNPGCVMSQYSSSCDTMLPKQMTNSKDSHEVLGPIRSQFTLNDAGRMTTANQSNSIVDQGFMSVRNALLKTSKCLDDIDDILSKKT